MAERLFTVDLNLGNNKAKNFRLEDFSNNPTSDLQSGRVIYFTGSGVDQNHFRVYNGTAWKTLAFTDDVPTIAINLDAATGFNVTGSPADASGTLTFEWDTVSPGHVLAGPLGANTSPAPSNAIPTFRALSEEDIPVEIARVDDIPVSGTDYIPWSEKGEALGVAELNASGVVPAEQLDLSDYVTLTGVETLTNKTFNDYISFTNPSTTPVDGTIGINDTNEDFEITSLVGDLKLSASASGKEVVVSDTLNVSDNIKLAGSLYFDYAETGGFPNPAASINAFYGMGGTELYITSLGNAGIYADSTNGTAVLTGYNASVSASNNVVLSGINGEYLGSEDPDNQIAKIGDLEALDAYDITDTQISNWDTAYGWGDHSTVGYLTTAVESISNTDGNITFSTSTGSVTADLATDVEIAGDLVVQGDLTVNGDVTTLNTATMNVEDNIFVLNSNVTGTPSVNAGIEVERGDSDNASLIWNETSDKWAAGIAGSEIAIARKYVTTTTGTTHTITHNLATSDVTVNCWLAGAQVEAAIVVTDANTVTVTTNSSITNLKTVVVG